MILDSKSTKTIPYRVRLSIERNVDEICFNQNPNSRVQRNNRDVRCVGTTRPSRGVALIDETCDLTDEEAQEATIRAYHSVNPGIAIVGTTRTVTKSHFEFCMMLCTWQHKRGALYILILTDREEALPEEQFWRSKHCTGAKGVLGLDKIYDKWGQGPGWTPTFQL